MSEKSLRKLSLAAAVSALIATPGLAADLSRPMYTKAPPAPVSLWSGFYIGAHVGGATGTIESDIQGFPIASGNVNGFLGGGQIGYNFQNGPIVFGVEADASASDVKGSTPCILVLTCDRKVDWFGTVAGRVGFTADRALIFVKGGGAFANFKYNTSFLGSPITSADQNKWGWTVGTGIEYAILGNWSAKVEYDFMDFGKDNVDFGIGRATLQVNSHQFIHAVKFGVNYHFGGPVAGAY